jgi:sugar (pentulose or hexulose) kinase
VVSWLDGRGKPFDDALMTKFGPDWFAARIGHRSSGLTIGQVLRLRGEDPDGSRRVGRIGFVGDAIIQRFCGRFVHDATSAGLTLLFNPRLGTYDPELLQVLGHSPEQLPHIQSIREPAGDLASGLADRCGLPAGIPVSVPVHDQYAAALGTGAVRRGQVMFGAGTAWVLLAITDTMPPLVTDDAFVCPHPVPGLFGQILSLRNGGSAFAWANKVLRLDATDAASTDRLLGSVSPGSEGVRFWPFLAGREPAGLPADIEGRWTGLKLAHEPRHLLRAVLEGLAYELNRHLDFLRHCGLSPCQLVLCGGASRSPATVQIIADVTGLPIECAGQSEASVLGAAIVAASLLEPDRPLEDLVARMVPAGNRTEPGPDRKLYQSQYRSYRDSLPPLSAPGPSSKSGSGSASLIPT